MGSVLRLGFAVPGQQFADGAVSAGGVGCRVGSLLVPRDWLGVCNTLERDLGLGE